MDITLFAILPFPEHQDGEEELVYLAEGNHGKIVRAEIGISGLGRFQQEFEICFNDFSNRLKFKTQAQKKFSNIQFKDEE